MHVVVGEGLSSSVRPSGAHSFSDKGDEFDLQVLRPPAIMAVRSSRSADHGHEVVVRDPDAAFCP
jgi:hypothetical protein